MATFKDLQLDWSMLCTEDDWTEAGNVKLLIMVMLLFPWDIFFAQVLALAEVECGFYQILSKQDHF